MPPAITDPGEFLADVRALEAAGADTVWVHGAEPEHWIALGAAAALTQRIRLGVAGAQVPDASIGVLQRISGGRVLTADPPGEQWVPVPVPSNRESWLAMLEESQNAGATGVVVPWHPKLIDLLRNPEPDDRSDLLMSTG